MIDRLRPFRSLILSPVLVLACESSTPRPAVEPANVSVPSMPASAPEPPPEPPVTSHASTSTSTAHWLVLPPGAVGAVTLRCEGTAEHPANVSGGCLCGSTILNPCDAARPEHDVDRRQCFFTCGDARAKVHSLRCPDGSVPSSTQAGCDCGGPDRILSPCGASTPSSVSVRGDVCTVTC